MRNAWHNFRGRGGFASNPAPRLAIGVDFPYDWARDNLLLDKARFMRPWIGHLAGGGWGGGDEYIVVDANGYPTSVPAELASIGTLILNDQAPEDADLLDGRYRVTFDGAGTLTFGGVSNVTSGAGWYEFDYATTADSVEIRITATTFGNHIHNIKCFHLDHAALVASGRLTNPDYFWGADKVAMLRFMDLQLINDGLSGDWAERPTPDYYSYAARGMPVEHIVQVANELQQHPWICIPWRADDNYVTEMMEYIEANLSPSLVCRLEWGNEAWNFIFAITTYCAEQAVAQGWPSGGDRWMQYAGMRAAECMDIAASVFAGQMHRIVRVIAVQTSWLGLEVPLLTAPESVADGNPPPYLSFDAYAVTGYFGGSLGSGSKPAALLAYLAANGESATLEWAKQELLDGSMTDDESGSVAELETFFDYHAGVCASYGFDLVMYEGGTHVVGIGEHGSNTTLTNFFIALNYSTQMGEIYDAVLAAWAERSSQMFNHYVGTRAPGQHGSWGAKRYLTDTNPRLTALTEFALS